MTSTASPSRSRSGARACVGSLAVAVTLTLGAASAQGSEVAAAAALDADSVEQQAAAIRTPNPFADRFPKRRAANARRTKRSFLRRPLEGQDRPHQLHVRHVHGEVTGHHTEPREGSTFAR